MSGWWIIQRGVFQIGVDDSLTRCNWMVLCVSQAQRLKNRVMSTIKHKSQFLLNIHQNIFLKKNPQGQE